MRLLIVGSLNGQIGHATKIAMERGAKVSHAGSIEQALETLRGGAGADLVFCDVVLEIGTLVRGLAAERICTPVVACGVGSDTRRAVDAIRAGAKEYLPLPADPELIAAVLAAVADESHQLIYEDEAMGAVLALADQVAGSEASILVTGESGTGKEVLARYVHRKSNRTEKPFISVNCAAIPENLLESELFGHEKGAFTGAIARRIGKFEEANGGTLLLDEISEMDARLQAKLLRAIQEREIDRVGGTKPVKVDIRIIATSNRDLAEAVKHGTFREDLLYRLNVVNLRLPALRERPKDIRALSQHFARKYAEANGVPFRPLAGGTERLLLGHPWRGNVRELENTIHRAVLLATGPEIAPEAIRLPDGTQVGSQPMPSHNSPVHTAVASAAVATRNLVGRTVADVERDLILDTLDHCLGNRTHAANILGISIRTLRNKLREYSDSGLTVPSHGEQRLAG
ncbi:MAG TPA: sigma-54 dependent transcriptional regulator [Rhizomicrobium sp.]|jgi:DNA-binding NtrC family response regulator|nr:sigma-54 dependent transcriptional regulator [Rhizomicrobium sp.]